MAPMSSFAVAAAPWQTFYVLVGTAAATLVGLMFVAVTFGSSMIKPETSGTALRFAALFRVHRHTRRAQKAHNDIELSDWITGLVVPLVCYLMLGSTGLGFIEGTATAFTALAVVTIAILTLGVFGAWELMLWMALTRAVAARASGEPPRE
jgi:hypothetical protein